MKLRLILILVGLSMTLSLAAATPASQPGTTATQAANDFAIDLYGQIRGADGNICISPYSINSALNMAATGAGGNTALQMIRVLRWTGLPSELSAASAALTASLQRTANADPNQPQSRVSIANALFGQRGFLFRHTFLDRLDHQFNCPLRQVDFSTAPSQACDQVNQWAAAKTNDRIKQILSPQDINAATRLILVDAVYFKANWQDAFLKSATNDQPFSTDKKEVIQVPMMHQTRSFDYVEDDSVQIAALPYQGDYELDVILPRSKDGLPAAEKTLTSSRMKDLFDKLSPRLLELSIPRFKMEGKYQLRDVLENLGMKDAFDPHSADFTGIASGERLNIDKVFQKTYISLDEEGTEAAAATGITMRSMAMRARDVPEKTIFLADHPFLFIIRYRPTGTLLFMGRICNPK